MFNQKKKLYQINVIISFIILKLSHFSREKMIEFTKELIFFSVLLRCYTLEFDVKIYFCTLQIPINEKLNIPESWAGISTYLEALRNPNISTALFTWKVNRPFYYFYPILMFKSKNKLALAQKKSSKYSSAKANIQFGCLKTVKKK